MTKPARCCRASQAAQSTCVSQLNHLFDSLSTCLSACLRDYLVYHISGLFTKLHSWVPINAADCLTVLSYHTELYLLTLLAAEAERGGIVLVFTVFHCYFPFFFIVCQATLNYGICFIKQNSSFLSCLILPSPFPFRCGCVSYLCHPAEPLTRLPVCCRVVCNT